MSRHNLRSPSSTYLVLPTVTVLNKDKAKTARPYHLTNPILLTNTPGATVSQNGSSFTQNAASKFNRFRTLHNPPAAVIIQGNRMNENTNILRGVVRDVTNQSPAQNIIRKDRNPRVGAVLPEHPSTSTQSNASNKKGKNNQKTAQSNKTPPKEVDQRREVVQESDYDSSDSSSSSDGKLRKLDFIRLPYSSAEDIEIVKFVIMDDNMYRTGSLSLWKELEKRKEKPKRTYQSLKNRFLRNIKPHLLTKFKNLINGEALNKVMEKFPELAKVSKRRKAVVEGNDSRRLRQMETIRGSTASSERCEATNQSSGREKPTTREAETNTNIDELVRHNAQQNVFSNHERNATATSDEFPGIAEGGKETTAVVPLNETSNVDASTAVELFVPRKSQNLPSQSFRCTKIIKTLQNKTNLNLNIVFLNDQSASLSRSTGPVKVDVVVSLSSVKENDIQETNFSPYQLTEKASPPKLVTKKVKKRVKKRPARGGFKYVLQLKKSNHQKLLTVTELYKETLADLLRKITKNGTESASQRVGQADGTLLRSRVPQPISDIVPEDQWSSTSSQETNCSVDDDSDYSEVYRQVSKTYQIIIEPDHDDSHEKDKLNEISNPKKRLKTNENPPKNNILLKNMVGMLSPSSKVFSGERSAGTALEKL